MDRQQTNDFLANLVGSELSHPFGGGVEVYKVGGKMFALLSQGYISEHPWLNLKCDPHQAQILRDIFPAVIAGYHMNKTHWNTVILDGTVPAGEIQRMIDHSYQLVIAALPKKQRTHVNLQQIHQGKPLESKPE
ncbi:MmcQ/YjbR family DNA-binding protein [Ferrimonas senticii]|uniref:MmcQ/YjbR family DNA-binding protein n=1 Tax=Ferrimonas senticii TaxID=394566 RepID=UPI00040BCC59|nr:MmcQ/YjbR family DNA-binding protein [Ferrimonas senticii]